MGSIQILGSLAQLCTWGQQVRFEPRVLEMAGIEPGDHVVGDAFLGIAFQLLAFLTNVSKIAIVIKPQDGEENNGKDELEDGERGTQQENAQARRFGGLAHAAEEGGDESRDKQDEEIGPEGAPEKEAVRKGLEAFLVGELWLLIFGLRSHLRVEAASEGR